MASTDTLCFGDRDPVTGDPQINGLVDYDYLPFDPADPFESGYVGGARVTYEGGGLPRVTFQGVRVPGGDKIVMGFFCRFDNHFDPHDLIVIALRSNFGSGPERLVAIYPNLDGVGVEPGLGSGPNHIKRNVTPPTDRIDYWSRNGGGPWVPMSDPVGVEVKLRSWLPTRPNGAPDEVAWSAEVSWPRVSADGFTLNDDFGIYFNVIRIFQPGDMAVQSAFPTDATDLPEEPGPGFVVPKYGHGLIPAIQVPVGKNTGLGVGFRKGLLAVGRRPLGSGTTSLTGTIEGPGGATDNEIVALVENTGTTDAKDIWAEFRFYNYGLPPATFPAWDLGAGMERNPSPRRIGVEPPAFDPPVDLAGTPQPTMPTFATLFTPWLRSKIPPQYINHEHQCIWVQLDSATGVNFTQSSIRRNMDFDHLSEIEREPEISGEGYPAPADGSSEHDFVLQTYCRQITVAELLKPKEIDPDAKALLEGVLGQGSPNDHPSTNIPAGTAGGSLFRNTVVYVWMAQGYRRTGAFIKIKGSVYENLDHTPGEFGIIARHEGLQDIFHYSFDGPGLVQYAPGVYGLKVPHKGKTTIRFKLGADRDGRPGDRSELPKAPWPKPGSIGPDDTETGQLPKGCLALLMGIFGKKQA